MPLTAAQKTTATTQLKGAGCPDDCCEKILATGISLDLITKLIALATKYGPTAWALIAELVALFGTPATP